MVSSSAHETTARDNSGGNDGDNYNVAHVDGLEGDKHGGGGHGSDGSGGEVCVDLLPNEEQVCTGWRGENKKERAGRREEKEEKEKRVREARREERETRRGGKGERTSGAHISNIVAGGAATGGGEG